MNGRHAFIAIAALALVLATGFTAYSFYKWRNEFLASKNSGAASSNDPLILPTPKPIPTFDLVTSKGAKFTRDDLVGKVWVADFVFSTCPESCPSMTRRMARLQDRILADPFLTKHVRLVSFSVDPEVDKPEVLRAYAEQEGADDEIWKFVTGDAGAVPDLSQRGFGLAAFPNPEFDTNPAAPRVSHSDRFVLVDHEARVRAYIPLRFATELVDELVDYVRSLATDLERAQGLGQR